jgi:hypothetical protein
MPEELSWVPASLFEVWTCKRWLADQSVMVEMVQDRELNLHFLKHPERGFLTAIQAGSAVLIVAGQYADLRERPFR